MLNSPSLSESLVYSLPKFFLKVTSVRSPEIGDQPLQVPAPAHPRVHSSPDCPNPQPWSSSHPGIPLPRESPIPAMPKPEHAQLYSPLTPCLSSWISLHCPNLWSSFPPQCLSLCLSPKSPHAYLRWQIVPAHFRYLSILFLELIIFSMNQERLGQI